MSFGFGSDDVRGADYYPVQVGGTKQLGQGWLSLFSTAVGAGQQGAMTAEQSTVAFEQAIQAGSAQSQRNTIIVVALSIAGLVVVGVVVAALLKKD